MAAILDLSHLKSFESCLLLRAPAALASLSHEPGLAGFDARLVDEGTDLPLEARRWWDWRNTGDSRVLPHLGFLPPSAARREYELMRKIMLDQAADHTLPEELRDIEATWPAAWVPILSSGGQPLIVLDARGGTEAPCPVLYIELTGIATDGYTTELAPSFGAFIADWTVAIERADEITYNPATGWNDRRERQLGWIPPPRR